MMDAITVVNLWEPTEKTVLLPFGIIVHPVTISGPQIKKE
jgi:hypothetical protein